MSDRLFCVLVVALSLAAGASGRAAEAEQGVTDALRRRAEEVLRAGLAKQEKFVRVHAAEALIFHGHTEGIEATFVGELKEADPQYRIGCLRVLARLAAAPQKRAPYVAEIRQVMLQPESTARGHAVETLAKLDYVPAEGDQALDVLAAGEQEGIHAYARWIVANSGKAPDVRRLAVLLDSRAAPVRSTVGYALRHLARPPPDVLQKLAAAARREPAGEAGRVYLVSAWYLHAEGSERAAARKILESYGREGATHEKYEVAAALGIAGDAADVGLLTSLLDDPEADARISAAHAILQIGKRI